jgi:hypothetical protein
MTTVVVSRQYSVSPEHMWHRIGDPGSLADWHPALEDTALVEDGRVRVNTLVGGGQVVEPIIERTGRHYTFRIAAGPLPFANFVSTLAVRDAASDGCVVDWRATFEADGVGDAEASELVRTFFEAGLGAL